MGRVIFLGTGDPLNGEWVQSSLAVLLSSEETMLIDASSGTVLLRQLEAAGSRSEPCGTSSLPTATWTTPVG